MRIHSMPRAILSVLMILPLLAACGGGGNENLAPGALFFIDLENSCDQSTIYRLPLDGGAVTPVYTAAGPDSADDIFVDSAGGKVYFVLSFSGANDDNRLLRVNLDGTGLEPVVIRDKSLPSPQSLDVDVDAGHLYVLLAGNSSEVVRSSLDGTGSVLVLTIPEVPDNKPSDLEIDPGSDSLFWSDVQFAPHITRSSLAGVGSTGIYTMAVEGSIRNLRAAGGKLYWIEADDAGPARIRRSEPDGSQVEIIVAVGGTVATTPRGLAVDAAGGHVYWSESDFCGNTPTGRIRRANLDGTDVQTILVGLQVPTSLAFVR